MMTAFKTATCGWLHTDDCLIFLL